MNIGIIATMKKGLEQFTYREVCGLASHGANITLFPTKQGPGLYDPPPDWNVAYWSVWSVIISQPLRLLSMPARYLSALYTALKYRAVIDFLLAAYFVPKLKQVDAVYATFGDHKLFVGYFAKLLLNKPLAVEIHAHELYVNPNPKLFIAALAACDQVIAATEYNRSLLLDRFGVDAELVHVVRCSVDLSTYRPAKKFVILIVAFFVERKGHEILFKAVKSLGLEDVEIWVVGGDGAESEAVDVPSLAKHLGLERQIAFFGKLSGTALQAVYLACDVFCLPCRHEASGNAEGFPVVLIEAMSCGKPVVTTRHVEIPAIVEHILVDENDVDGLADALRLLYESADLRAQLGNRNRQLAEKHFSSHNVVKTFRLLERLVSGDLKDPTRFDDRSTQMSPEFASSNSVASDKLVGSSRFETV